MTTDLHNGNRVVRITSIGGQVVAVAYVGGKEHESEWICCRSWHGKTVRGAEAFARKFLAAA